MAPALIDSHVHFWSSDHANAEEHPWISSVPQLAQEHSPSQYLEVSQRMDANDQQPGLKGVIYIETDRSQSQHFPYKLNELHYLSNLIREYPDFVLGVVPWAPLERDVETFSRYLKYIQSDVPIVWRKLRGFRVLLQGIRDQDAFERMLSSEDLLSCLRHFRHLENGLRELVFDVGIDQRSAGTWQLGAFARMLERMRGEDGSGGPIFVLDHFCKPDLVDHAMFDAWRECMRKLAAQPRVYMKLSGLFSELPSGAGQQEVADIALVTGRWFKTVLELFGPRRCMFGSDWPVCNLAGHGEHETWRKWYEAVSVVLDRSQMTGEEKQFVWWRTANEAYGLGHDVDTNSD